jgi:small subunit ribosomal protein S13
MARIAGVDLPKAKRMEIALTYIFGIGRSTSRKLLQEAGVDLNVKTDALAEDDLLRLPSHRWRQVEGDLRREVALNIKRYVDLGACVVSASEESSGARPAHPHQRTHP